MRKLARWLWIVIPSLLLSLVGYIGVRLKLSMPRTDGKLSIPCLDSDVEVIFDKAGIPHITADNSPDGYRALGYIMAQDRIVQMQAMLHVAMGTLSELVGSMALDLDRFLRTIGLGRLGNELAENLDPESLERLEYFCEGVNTYLSRSSARLPFEFMFLKGRPDPWVPANCLVLGIFYAWQLDSFWPADLVREKLIRSLGLERAMELLPETADFNNPPVKVEGPGVDAETLEPGEEIDWDLEGGSCGGECFAPTRILGSNNWVIGGSRTTTGKPILASDPHLQHTAPSVWYLYQLRIPQNDVIGATFPGVPIVAIGHNGYCGWAPTSLCPDTQDLYVETFESEESDRYLCEGEWVEPKVIEEELKIRFSRPRSLKTVITRHGPVIKRKGNKGLAIKWTGDDTTLDSLCALIRQNQAGSWEEFLGAMENFVGPAMNQVYADIDGNIGYLAAAKVPRRTRGDGTIPYDGSDGGCEWDGYVPFDEMPSTVNPDEGFLATANSKIVSDGYTHLITKAWEAPYRNGRISELIRSREKWGIEDMSSIHGDVFTFPGRRFARMAVSASSAEELSPAAREAVEYLSEWDYQARSESVAMCIYFYAWHHLTERLLRHRLGSTLFNEYGCGWTSISLAVEGLLESGDKFWLPPGYDSYEKVVLDSLEDAVVELEGVFETTDQSTWEWGRIHHLTCESLLGLFWPLDRIFNVGPVPRDGEGDTVNAAVPGSDCLAQVLGRGTTGFCSSLPVIPDCDSHADCVGAGLRVVLDFSDLDNSRVILDVGQSGHRLSPHYKDHFHDWLEVEYGPLPYSREMVQKEAGSTLHLTPGR